MRIVSGVVKANKEDIAAMKTFLHHAEIDMSYGGGGSYINRDFIDEGVDEKEFKKGVHGKECIEFLLERLCDKWR